MEGGGEFSSPTYIAVDDSTGASKGDVYVGDTTANVVFKFDGTGKFISSNEALFGPLDGIAVDGAGNLWVYDKNQNMFEFDPEGTQLRSFNSGEGPGSGLDGLAIDASDNAYFVNGFGTVVRFTETGNVDGPVLREATPSGLAANLRTNDLYVDTGSEIQRVGLGPSCNPAVEVCPAAEAFGASHLTAGAGVAVDDGDNAVYAADSAAGSVARFAAVVEATTGPAEESGTESATVTGTVNADGSEITDCRFEYGVAAGYGQSAPCVESVGSGTTAVRVHARLSGLQGGTAYHFRLVATNAKGTARGEDETLQTIPGPVIDSTSATNVSETSADLNASIDTKELATTYHFEWGLTTAYEHSVPLPGEADQIAAGMTTDQTVSQHIPAPGASPLEANKTYHWRVVAQDVNGTTTTADHTFVYDTGGAGLPDGRQYEMVTPPHKNGALIGDVVLGVPPEIAENGSRVIGTSIQCFGGSESCTASRETEGEPFAFTRTAGGWVTSVLAPPATRFEAGSYWTANADTGSALFSVPTPPGGEDDWYVRRADGSLLDIGPTSPPSAGALGVGDFSATIHLATADFSHIVWESAPAWPEFDATNQGGSLYEYQGAGNVSPALIGVSGGAGSTDLISRCGTRLGGSIPNTDGTTGALSEDGSVVYFTAAACPAAANAGVEVPAETLYARIGGSRTVEVSQRSSTDCDTACQSSPASGATFQGASTDGATVFFTSPQQLTSDATQDDRSRDSAEGTGCSVTVGSGCNLYEYENVTAENSSERRLVDVSAGDSSGGGPRVRGVVAISSDGSHVYFVAQGLLSDQPNAEGQTAREGENNLYVFEHDAANPNGHLVFIATLPSSVNMSPANTFTGRELWVEGTGAANVTPDGRFLVFASQSALTPDETRTDGAQQLFRYDAQTGELTRISIGNDGFDDNGNAGFGDARIAFPVNAGRPDPTMSHDGSFVFFESPIGLTPGALDDVQTGTATVAGVGGEEVVRVYAQNVYEYHDGHVYLVSDGKDTGQLAAESDVRLIGSDATGANVFFSTSDPLVATDTDTQLDYYDARICTAGEPCIASPPPALQPCLGEACHGIPPATPPPPAPGSGSFNGAGNAAAIPATAVKHKALTRAQKLAAALEKCRKIKKKGGRARCERQAHRQYGPASKSKSKSTSHRGNK